MIFQIWTKNENTFPKVAMFFLFLCIFLYFSLPYPSKAGQTYFQISPKVELKKLPIMLKNHIESMCFEAIVYSEN